MKKLVIFDLDGTLAESKSAMDAEMAQLLSRLMTVTKVAIISGGDWPQFDKQVVQRLPQGQSFHNLLLLPTCGTKFFRHEEGAWKKLYSEDFTADEKQKILSSMERAISEAGYKPTQTWGDVVEDRGSQITFSALGQQAPLEPKHAWDPDFAKRTRIKAILDQYIPEFSVRMGGATSIDVTKPGIDKAYGIAKLRDLCHIAITEMIFIGDAIFPGGNDYPPKEMGVDSICIRDVHETKRTIEGIILCLAVR